MTSVRREANGCHSPVRSSEGTLALDPMTLGELSYQVSRRVTAASGQSSIVGFTMTSFGSSLYHLSAFLKFAYIKVDDVPGH